MGSVLRASACRSSSYSWLWPPPPRLALGAPSVTGRAPPAACSSGSPRDSATTTAPAGVQRIASTLTTSGPCCPLGVTSGRVFARRPVTPWAGPMEPAIGSAASAPTGSSPPLSSCSVAPTPRAGYIARGKATAPECARAGPVSARVLSYTAMVM